MLLFKLINHLLIRNPQVVLPANYKQSWELVNLNLEIGTRGATLKYIVSSSIIFFWVESKHGKWDVI
jgi:hypothetical protein